MTGEKIRMENGNLVVPNHPIVPFIDTCVDSVSTPENFQQRVAKLRELGADGYVIWRYGGPGDGQGSPAGDEVHAGGDVGVAFPLIPLLA